MTVLSPSAGATEVFQTAGLGTVLGVEHLVGEIHVGQRVIVANDPHEITAIEAIRFSDPDRSARAIALGLPSLCPKHATEALGQLVRFLPSQPPSEVPQ